MNMSSDDEMTDCARLARLSCPHSLAEWTETGLPHAFSHKRKALFASLIRRGDRNAQGGFSIVSAYIDQMPYSANP